MTGSKNLIQLPNLSTSKNFEELIVKGCKKLQKIPESLKGLYTLNKLNAGHCDSLTGILFDAESILSGAPLVFHFSDVEVSMGFLEDLSIYGQIDLKLQGLYGLIEHISFISKQQICDELVRIKKSLHLLNIKNFRYRESNAAFSCKTFSGLNIKDIPSSIMSCRNLEKLDLSGNDFVYLPYGLKELHKLKYLSVHNCRRIKSLRQLPQVETLILSECVKLRSLFELCLGEPWATSYCLLELWLDNCNHIDESLSEQLSHFTKLTYLNLSRNNFVTLPQSIRELSSLGTLYLNNCKKLKSLQELPQGVKYLHAHGCDSLEKVSLSSDHSIKHLDILHCPRLKQEEHKNLMDLFMNDEQSQEGSPPCACLRETGGSSNSSSETSETSKKFGPTRKLFRSIKSVFS